MAQEKFDEEAEWAEVEMEADDGDHSNCGVKCVKGSGKESVDAGQQVQEMKI